MARAPLADEQVVRTLYADHGAPLLNYVSRLVSGDRQRAEDIVQETLLRAWRNPAAVTSADGRSPRAWLFTVARNLVIDAHRARRSRPKEAPEVEAPDHRGGDDPMGDVLTRFEMLEALEGLTPQHRDVIVALFYRGCSVAEAAALLGVPPGTVKSRSHYALKALRVLCDERGLLT